MGSKTLWKNLRSMGFMSSRQYLSDVDTQTANNEQSINTLWLWQTLLVIILFCFVHKGARSFGVSDFRPISIQPALSNFSEEVSKRQIYDHLVSHNLLCTFQSGFRPAHSTATAMLKIVDDIRCELDCRLLLLDFSKPFDTVDHVALV